MARGNEAKEKLINRIATALGDSYLGCFDKKYFFLSEENGEAVQIAMTLTCPKTPIEIATNVAEPDGDWDFSDTAPAKPTAVTNAAPAEITQEEKDNIVALMKRLGL